MIAAGSAGPIRLLPMQKTKILKPAAEPRLSGIQFPLEHSGRRSTQTTGQRIVAAALEGLDAAAARAALSEREWRTRYPVHLRALVAAQAAATPEAVVASCQAGLDALWTLMPFVQPGRDEADSTLADALVAGQADGLLSATLRGRGDAAPARWAVPWRGKWLSDDALRRQIDRWEHRGIAEPSHCQALRKCLAHPEWFDLSDRHIVLLGAGSEAGPLGWLARWRAHLIAVDLPRPTLWKRIGAVIDAGNATLTAPVDARQTAGRTMELPLAGADLLTQTPALGAWLKALRAEAGASLDVGSLAYLDGERHVRVSLAMDALAALRCADDPGTTLAYLATPTDLFAVPAPLAQAVRDAYTSRGLVKRLAQAGVRAGSRGRTFLPHIESLVEGPRGAHGIVDALVVEQGPNYALAKRMQQWRAVVARAAGHRVSLNVAPSTTTASVVKNPLLAAGFRGARAFNCEVFEPATTNALMAALWVHDLRTTTAPADPSVPLAHPLDFIADGANHGGLWRLPYLPRSVLPLAALVGMVRRGS